MPVTPYLAKAMLDWVTGAATPTRPGQRWISLATQSPTTASAFDGAFTSRASMQFAAANSPQMSVTNASTSLNTTLSASIAATAVGWNLYDSTAGGTRLLYGTVTANIGFKAADNYLCSAGQCKITLS